jgi:hypothetical protein
MSPSGSSSNTPPAGAPGDPATVTHGPGETLLTGTDLQKATAAATAAVPGATIIRAETNSSGASPYEVHMKKSDGTEVTVELDSNFASITTIPALVRVPQAVMLRVPRRPARHQPTEPMAGVEPSQPRSPVVARVPLTRYRLGEAKR